MYVHRISLLEEGLIPNDDALRDLLFNPMCKFSCQGKGSWSLLDSEELQVSEEGCQEGSPILLALVSV